MTEIGSGSTKNASAINTTKLEVHCAIPENLCTTSNSNYELCALPNLWS